VPNPRTIALIVVALSCCSAAARAGDALPAPAPTLALPEARALTLLALAFSGLVYLGRRPR
jgi:hypothetical protein